MGVRCIVDAGIKFQKGSNRMSRRPRGATRGFVAACLSAFVLLLHVACSLLLCLLFVSLFSSSAALVITTINRIGRLKNHCFKQSAVCLLLESRQKKCLEG